MTPPTGSVPVIDLLRCAEHALGGVGVVLTTSGSTGRPKHVELSAAALQSSAAATAERVGGHGQWLLTLPPDHVAGWQVVVRSAVAGTVPVRLEGSFTVQGFTSAAGRLAGPRFVSLVPTQLLRLVEAPSGLAALTEFDAVLVGGAALSAPLLAQAETAGVRIHRTYGMTETSGGCVYDGTPLTEVSVALDEGRVLLGGAVLASRYVHDPDLTAAQFTVDDAGRRWFRTDDLGELVDGQLRLLGRVDDVINTGGFKVGPRPVEEALLRLPGVQEALVLAVPDREWGQRVAAVLVGAQVPLQELRERLRPELAAHSLPRQVLWVEALPLLRSGKPDLAALRQACAGEGDTMGSRRSCAE